MPPRNANPLFTALSPTPTVGTPQADNTQRRIAEAMLREASSTAPVRSVFGVLNRALQGFQGGQALREASAQEEEQRQAQLARSSQNDDLKRQLIHAQIQKALAGPKPTALQQNLQAAGISPGTPEFRQAVLKGQDRSINISNQFDQNTLSKELAKETAKAVSEVTKKGLTSGRDAGLLQIAQKALENPNVFTGTGGQAVQGLKRGLSTLFGVDVRGVADTEVLDAVGKQIALQKKDQIPGPMSDPDREFLVAASPGLSKTPEGNRLLIAIELAGKRHDIELAQAVAALRARGELTDGSFAQLQADQATKYFQEAGPLFARVRAQSQIAPRSPGVGIPNLPQGVTVEVE